MSFEGPISAHKTEDTFRHHHWGAYCQPPGRGPKTGPPKKASNLSSNSGLHSDLVSGATRCVEEGSLALHVHVNQQEKQPQIHAYSQQAQNAAEISIPRQSREHGTKRKRTPAIDP